MAAEFMHYVRSIATAAMAICANPRENDKGISIPCETCMRLAFRCVDVFLNCQDRYATVGDLLERQAEMVQQGGHDTAQTELEKQHAKVHELPNGQFIDVVYFHAARDEVSKPGWYYNLSTDTAGKRTGPFTTREGLIEVAERRYF